MSIPFRESLKGTEVELEKRRSRGLLWRLGRRECGLEGYLKGEEIASLMQRDRNGSIHGNGSF